jgi:hypothetical protein
MGWDIKTALFFVVFCDVLIVLSQAAITEMTDGEGPVYFSFDDSMMSLFNAGEGTGSYDLQDFNGEDLPESSGGIMESIGQFFTDIFNTITGWVMSIPGAKYIAGTINAVPHLIGSMGLPSLLSFTLAFLWHATTVMLLIFWIKG